MFFYCFSIYYLLLICFVLIVRFGQVRVLTSPAGLTKAWAEWAELSRLAGKRQLTHIEIESLFLRQHSSDFRNKTFNTIHDWWFCRLWDLNEIIDSFGYIKLNLDQDQYPQSPRPCSPPLPPRARTPFGLEACSSHGKAGLTPSLLLTFQGQGLWHKCPRNSRKVKYPQCEKFQPLKDRECLMDGIGCQPEETKLKAKICMYILGDERC